MGELNRDWPGLWDFQDGEFGGSIRWKKGRDALEIFIISLLISDFVTLFSCFLFATLSFSITTCWNGDDPCHLCLGFKGL